MSDEEFNPYQSTETSDISLEQQLLGEQNYFGTVVGACVGAIPGYLIYVMLIGMSAYSVLAYIIPGLVIGLFAGFMGRGIDRIHKLTAALVALVFLLVIGLLVTLTHAQFLFSLFNLPIAWFTGQRRLTREQDDALFEHKIGLKKRSKINQ